MNQVGHSKQRFATRKIRFHIITIFVALFTLFSVITAVFTYIQNYKSIITASKEMMMQVDNTVINKLSDIKNQAELLAESTRGLITSEKEVSPNNAVLIGYLLNALKFNNLINSICIATENGNLISAFNLTQVALPISGSLPPATKYAIQAFDRSGPTPTEKWQYLGTDLQILESKSTSPVDSDLKKPSWYQDTFNWPHIHWSRLEDPSHKWEGIVVTAPAIGFEENVIGVVAVNLSLDQLSNYISYQQIGRSGQVCILDRTGHLFIPNIQTADKTSSNISSALISSIYDNFQKTKETNFILKQDKIDYLALVRDFPVSFETHWLVLITVPVKDFFGPMLRTQKQALLMSCVFLLIFSVCVYIFSRRISAPIVELSTEVNRIQNFDFQEKPPMASHISEILTLDEAIRSMKAALKSFGRYIPKEIVKTLIKQGKEISLGGEKKHLTILFSDIAGFTTVSESIPMETLLPAITQYFDRLSRIILESEGTIDKFIGDAIMAFWGAPQPVTDPEYKACLASLQCLVASDRELKTEGVPNWHTRFGIHSGEVIVGNIGTSERMNYTVLGDVVNTASRLEGSNKLYHSSIIISEIVQNKVSQHFVTRPLDFVAVKGKTQKIHIYELVGTVQEGTPLSATPQQRELCTSFTAAYKSFYERNLESAKKQFLTIQQRFPEDVPTQIYLSRIEKGE